MTSTRPTIGDLRTRLILVPLGAGRGGSGATHLQVVHTTISLTDGAQGTGFTYSLAGGAEAMQSLLDSLYREAIVGSELHHWERVWHRLWNATHRLGRGVALPALSAVDIAVWDLRAKLAELPLYELLGAYRDEVPIYGSGRATHQMTDEELIAGTRSYVEEGVTNVKLRAGSLGLERDLQRTRAVREAVGDSVLLMVDCNERLDFASALWLGRRLEELDIIWMEEPLIADDIAGHARLASVLRVPLAVGEHLLGRFEFTEYVSRRAAAVLQPDAPLVGGVSEWMRIATIAEAANLTVSPHFLPELHVHLAAATKACSSVEHFPLVDDLLDETLSPKGGVVHPPQRPGHGLLWNTDALNEFQVS